MLKVRPMGEARAKTFRDSRERLKGRGLRFSRPRELILDFFGEGGRHVSAEGLYLALRERGEKISLSTVYLNLGVLKSAGLIRELAGRHGETLYDGNAVPHHHLICKGCGAILDISLETVHGMSPAALIKMSAESASGWRVDEPKLDLQGFCPGCA
jgi:Fur family transcriptional regulator, peroxide stress response regulator